MRRSLGWATVALCGALACQDDTRPGRLSDPEPAPPEPGSLIDPSELPDPTMVSSCGAATVTLDFVRPNLYFAIDASGSMSDGIPLGAATDEPGTAPPDRYAALARAIQALLARVGHRVNYGATLFPTADETCDPGEEVQPLGPGDDVSFAVSGDVGPVLRSFMFDITRRSPRGGTPVALALAGLLERLRAAGPETYVLLVTDGGPNCNPSQPCGPDTCIPNLERLRVSETLVCDESINCCAKEAFGAENCLDTSGSVSAVQALAAAGVRTFVIGIPGSEPFADVLDQLAVAGGAARPDTPRYYRVSDAEELVTIVGDLGRTVALGCDIELREPPPDPTRVNLYFDRELVPSDPVDGWTFSNETTVTVHGTACELLRTGQVLQADVVAGCPIVIL